jgi:hypothetical protein
VTLDAELAHIDANHRNWLLARGEYVPELPARHRKVKPTE